MTTTAPAQADEQHANEAFLRDVEQLMDSVTYRGDDYRFEIAIDKADPAGRVFLQLQHYRPDAFTGEMAWGNGGKRYLSEHMTASEIIRVALGAALAYEEHEVREFFLYEDKAIFGPHIDIVALHAVADRLDVRS